MISQTNVHKMNWNFAIFLHVAGFLLAVSSTDLIMREVINLEDFHQVKGSDNGCSEPIQVPGRSGFSMFGQKYFELSVCTDGIIALHNTGFDFIPITTAGFSFNTPP